MNYADIIHDDTCLCYRESIRNSSYPIREKFTIRSKLLNRQFGCRGSYGRLSCYASWSCL